MYVGLVLGVLCWGTAGLPAEAGELEQLMDNAGNTGSGSGVPDRDTEHPSSVDAAWFARQAVAAGATAEQRQAVELLRQAADKPEEQQIQAIKAAILKKFQITIFEGQASQLAELGQGYASTTAHWGESTWTVPQLQAVHDTLDKLPARFRGHTKRISKFKQETEVVEDGGRSVRIEHGSFGRVLQESAPDTVNLFDTIFTEPKYAVTTEKGLNKLKSVLVHEMTHCYQYVDIGRRGTRLEEWSQRFWFKVSEYKNADGYPLPETHDNPYVPWMDLSKDGYWERGIPVSIYGGALQRRDSGLSATYIGAEDMAEAATFLACAKRLMAERFPERAKFLNTYIFDSELKDETMVGDLAFNPRWYGYSETEIFHAPKDGNNGRHWGDVGAGGSRGESWPESHVFLNPDDVEINALNATTTHLLKDLATVPDPPSALP